MVPLVLVVIAPDSFGGSLSASQVATALGEGWRRGAPHDTVELVPLSDGGPGFVDVLAAALPSGELLPTTVEDPYGRPVPAAVLLDGTTAYVESAQACGLHLMAPEERDPERASTRGVGQLLRVALDAGAGRVVVGLGGSGTNDAGLGALETLGDWPPSVELVAASDVDAPLTGASGATAVFGPQKLAPGAGSAVLDRLERRMVAAAEVLRERAGRPVAGLDGAGAAGGLGAALLALGATRVPGIALVMEAVGLRDRLAGAGVVVTGEGCYDATSLRGKVPNGVARWAQAEGVPCVVVAGVSAVGVREARAHAVDEVHTTSEAAGGEAGSLAEPARWLAVVAERLARQWSPARSV